MKPRRQQLLFGIVALALSPIFGRAVFTQAAKRPIDLADVIAWKTISSPVLSNDGQWFALRLAPQDGDAQVEVKRTDGTKALVFPIGEVPKPTAAAPGGGRGGAAGSSAVAFSDDGKWVAFETYPTRRDAERLKRQRRPIQAGVTIVDLSTGQKHEYSKIKRFAFSGAASGWIALQRMAPEAPQAGAAGAGAAPAGRGGTGGTAPERPRGTDLILRNLGTGTELNVGNVSEFAFTKDGRLLAYAIDAQDKDGNGVQLRDMTSGVVSAVDSGDASYERISWTDKGDGLAVLKGVDTKAFRDKLYSVIGVSEPATASARKVVFDPTADSTFPKDMTISPSRTPEWTDDLGTLIFGIHAVRENDDDDAGAAAAALTPGTGPAAAADATSDDDKVDLVLWHYKDPRLQTEQEVQAAQDRAFSYASEYRVAEKRFIRLADESMRTVTVNLKSRWAFGTDDREYELMGSLDGRRYDDMYAIDLTDGHRTLAKKHVRYFSSASPDGTKLLYYEDGDYFVYSIPTAQERNITRGLPVSFVNIEDDHNNVKPPINAVGWSSDSKTVLLTDAWDVWAVPLDGGAAVNLTVNGKKDQVRYEQRFVTDRLTDRNEGIDLSKPIYFRAYGEWTKKGGIARIDPGKPGVKMLAWDDASYPELIKAKRADTFVYEHGTVTDPNDYFAAGPDLASATRLTDQRPQLEHFDWSPGVQLVNYTCEKGEKLQAALFLPANYEKGKSYPTLVNFYEKMSNTANTFQNPTSNGFSRSLYTSNGYAVLVPDIVYHVNDPGMSAVWCMVPAVKAAIATGIVDPKHVGITGHSWGGYQTAFLVTQTDIFAAAVAGAPLTDMVSMYSLVYKNTGGWNGAIFESSQGRFKGGYWDNWDAYYRNSPVFWAKNVHTPLMILSDDKDGAVDFTQGVEYFNTLRRMQKPVILLEYLDENHSLRKPANQRDYTARMLQYFDHYLKGAPAPDWMVKGVPYLQMPDHLKAFEQEILTPAKSATPDRSGSKR